MVHSRTQQLSSQLPELTYLKVALVGNCFAEIRSLQVRVAKVCPAAVSLGEVRTAEILQAEHTVMLIRVEPKLGKRALPYGVSKNLAALSYESGSWQKCVHHNTQCTVPSRYAGTVKCISTSMIASNIAHD